MKQSYSPRLNKKARAVLLYGFTVLCSSYSFGQINIQANNESALAVMKQIEKQSTYHFVYDETQLTIPKVKLRLSDVSLKEALDAIFTANNIQYKIVKNTILLKNAPTGRSTSTTPSTPSQQYKLHGKISDAEGKALNGATITIKNSGISTKSDQNGQFELTSPTRSAVLNVSFLGYESLEFNANDEPAVIVLQPSMTSLAEVDVTINTGYQTIAKERATGAFASLPKNSLQQQRLNNLGSLLEGRIAGYHDGLLRGTTSMRGVTSPLYVIDGFPVDNATMDVNGRVVENLPDLNLEDIESVTVLKDAAAASIYGARAANGVVVIVTKKGKNKGTEINVSATLTHTPYYFNTDRLASAADMIAIEREWAAKNPNLKTMTAEQAKSTLNDMSYQSLGIRSILKKYAGLINESQMNAELDRLSQQGYRFYDDIAKYAKRNPLSQQYNLNLSNGTEKSKYYFSTTYKKDLLEDRFSKNQNLGINLRNITQINKWLTVEMSSFLNYADNDRQTYDVLKPGFSFLPYNRLKNDDGSNYTAYMADYMSLANINSIKQYGLNTLDITPVDEIKNNIEQSNGFSNRSFLKLNATIAEWLSYSASFQYEISNRKIELLYGKNSYYTRSRVNQFALIADGKAKLMMPNGNINKTTDLKNNAFNFRQQINIDKDFGEKHSLNAILGSELRNNRMRSQLQNLYNFDPDALTYTMLDPAIGTVGSFNQTYDNANQYESTNRFISFYGNVGYTYSKKYLLTGSLRWDRSNLWGTSSKYQNKPIWSIGAGWNLHEENFVQLDWLDQLKLRTSYGIGGNILQNVAPFMTAYYNTNSHVGGTQGSVSDRPNPSLSWEKTTTTNIGLDFGLFRNRLSGSLDYYRKQGKDLFASTMGVPTEGFGYSTYAINNGEMTNHGLELTLNANILQKNDFSWNSSVLYAYNKNKVTYVNVKAPFYILQLDYPDAYPRIGNPYQAIYAYKWAGLDQQGIPQVYDENGNKSSQTPTTLESIVYAGTKVPTHTLSWTNSLSYKNFDFSMMFTYEGGNKIRNTDLPYMGIGNYLTFTTLAPMNKDIRNRWQQEGDESRTNIPRLVFPEETDLYNSASGTVYQYADINVLDARNVRIRNISLAYRLPADWVKKMRLAQARLQFNAENVAMFTKSSNAKFMLEGYRAPNYVFGAYLTF
ncbi:SusC/RagA family TonB-linked outer membrane protein [Sphingobacterium sp. CZ-UAM]|uniref:SusC/RagA family TonB-linked outer membrane protein n=1 Tax=Sphingobacterium sp. CZ-UAM TaxID=1933868 RepID=UPI000986C646|nr:SusC/RagA family TonB-linked outer membrane protein [Sphingobacterium sp. CZ-UAM]OOG17918.1 SusC/RagA family TonB-linked outer membrane protein [Sphingobacterium sp. CZ-UAM]